MASQLNSLNFSNYVYHKNPFRLISDVKKEFNGILTGLTGCLGVTEYIDYFMIMEREDYLSQLDTTSYSTFEFALMHPNVDENGEIDIKLEGSYDNYLTIDELGITNLEIDLLNISKPIMLGNEEFTVDELLSESCKDDLKKIFADFEDLGSQGWNGPREFFY